MIAASAAQRAGTFLSTLLILHVGGAVDLAAAVPLLPLAPLAGAIALIGQEQAVLRHLLERDAYRLTGRSQLGVALWVGGIGAAASVILGVAVAALFPVPVWAACASAVGGTCLAIAQAAGLSQIRALRSGEAYLATYAVFGAAAIGARALALGFDLEPPAVWAIGDLVSGVLVASFSIALAQRLPGHRIDYDLPTGLRYGRPLVPHALAQQLLSNADRWIFTGRVAAAQLASYVAAYQLANIVNIVLAEVNRSRQHQYVGLSKADAPPIARREFRLLIGLVAALALPVSLASALLVGDAGAGTFWIAAGICLSFASLALYLPAANLIGLALGNTRALATASFAGATINIGLNFALVDALGVWAGVVANFAGFLMMYAVLRWRLSQA